MRACPFLGFLLATATFLGACSKSDEPPTSLPPEGCPLAGTAFEPGDPVGHADPFGAKAASQARAGRIKDAATFPQPAHERQQVQTGDFLLINDKIAVVIEDKGLSDGYSRFGGEILAIDKVGADGRPMGVSRFGEALLGISVEMINPTSVSVLRDGSDGGAAVVRVTGPLAAIPFLEGPIKAIFPRSYDLQMAYDYMLEPGAESFRIRIGVINAGTEPIDFGKNRPDKDEFYGFFQYSQAHTVTPQNGYAKQGGEVDWVGFDSGPWNFAFMTPGDHLYFGLDQSGFALYWGSGFVAGACSTTTVDRIEFVAGGPEYDGLREAIRRVTGEPPWREVTGVLRDAKGKPLPDAWIHGLDAGGRYLTRTRTLGSGAFTLHAPPSDGITIVPQQRGYPAHAGTKVDKDTSTVALSFGDNAVIHVIATDSATKNGIPVRIQVIPKDPPPTTPDNFGVLDELDGRLHQEFAMTGEARLTVPPGSHRVIVSRGYEWELFDTTVDAVAGATVDVVAPLVHSVDTTGVMCADFHIHSSFSADSNDPVEHKVMGAIADGLDVPVSSEHEWVADFQPIIERLGLSKWAFGMASSELTTFAWGHFGVVPLTPRPGTLNSGAVDWIGKDPAAVFAHIHALPEDPVLIINHPRGASLGAYFSAASYDREHDTGDPALWSDDFDAVEVFNDSDLEKNRQDSLADWFALLNHGHRVWAVGNSDSHHLRTSPVGYPRTCFHFGHDDPTKLTPSVVRDAVRSGDSTVSGGLTMTVSGPGGERPGQIVTAAGGSATFVITVEAPSFIAADTLETIVNGVTVSVEPLLPLGGGPSKKFVNQVTVDVDPKAPRTWVVFHAKGETDLAPLHPGRRPFAVSNPVFLKAP